MNFMVCILLANTSSRELFGDAGHVASLEAADFQLVLGGLAPAVASGESARAVGRPARDLIHVHDFPARIGDADDDHAVMQKRRMERRDRGLLTAMLRARRGEDAAD